MTRCWLCTYVLAPFQVVLKLGGRVTESVNECTHLVATRVCVCVCVCLCVYDVWSWML